MRIWHKDLIQVLPKQQLVGQLRELTLIIKNIQEKGTPNHILVNKVCDYPLDHLYTYCWLILQEFQRRKYKVTQSTLDKWNSLFANKGLQEVSYEELFYNWHNYHYFTICYYNLMEKYECSGINQKEWHEIKIKYQGTTYKRYGED